MNILIKNVSIVTMRNENEILNNSNIYIKGKYITHIGDELSDFVADKIIDGENLLALPGLINTHTHISMVLMRNYADDVNLEDWLFNNIFPIENKLIPEDIYYASLLAMIEMIKTGTTTFVDMYFFVDQTIKALEKLPMRAAICRGLTSGENAENNLNEVIELSKKYKNNDMLQIMIAPHAVYTCNKDFLTKCINAAKKNNLSIHIHLNESKSEVKNSIEENGLSPIQYVNELGMFEVNTLAAHCANTSDEDLKILKEKNVNVLNNPTSNLKLASGFARVFDMKNMGINVSLGTDGAASNNSLNMFREIHLASILNKAVENDPKAICAFDALKMATLNGAKAIKMEDKLGTLEANKLADLILIDINKTHLLPKNNLISMLSYSVSGFEVVTSIINGNIVMENGKITCIDEEEIKKALIKCHKNLMNR
ncbi:amidohydrolase [Caviibacter abscessus]|uniref:amidohydrolase n=1 Tax=Caviibacter abscessus TaxID=1766719 RepID=UPI00082AD1AC|nr:amidohydrolase [Caviibacter abscessus]